MRSIFRFSINGEKDSKLRNELAAILENAGYRRNPRGTATYEAEGLSTSGISTAMQEFWHAASNPPEGVSMDHVWMYADNPLPDES